jgi:lactate dehydrogenase-like 2-hydroxyacid dehydrogenase
VLHAALQEGRIRGAALDVTETEPLPQDSPLWELDNVLLSPHCADRTKTFQVSLHNFPLPVLIFGLAFLLLPPCITLQPD